MEERGAAVRPIGGACNLPLGGGSLPGAADLLGGWGGPARSGRPLDGGPDLQWPTGTAVYVVQNKYSSCLIRSLAVKPSFN